jgi:hypothetical protein
MVGAGGPGGRAQVVLEEEGAVIPIDNPKVAAALKLFGWK